ncbi:MAG: COX15/CtaA family protein [Actinobacteria bacterium]|nr:COX15/CtaA family protein [Actinomycetota bacterium]
MLARLRRPELLRWSATASLLANVAIVVTGGAVRLTNSGLGCPTWPRCTDASLTPTKAAAIHGVIEFTNRQLTFVVGLLALITLVIAWVQHRERGLAVAGFAGIPAQAVLGGITVLTHLNPYAVAAHFLLSMAIIAVFALLWWRVSDHVHVPVAPAGRQLGRTAALVTAVTLALGTVVTGSGPHAGDLDADKKLHRIHLAPSSAAQLHADAVMVLIGVTIGIVALVYAVRAAGVLRRAALVAVVVELAQGIIGYTQYFLHVPAALVALHMFGACLVWLAALRVLFLVEPRAVRAAG